MPKTDMFGNVTGGQLAHDVPVRIPDNPVLERACNRLLDMIRKNPSLIDGDSMGQIDRRLYAEVAWEDRFAKLVAPERKDTFIQAMMGLPEPEVFTRARRELLSRDRIRVSSKAVKSGEQHRARIAGAMR